MCECQDFIELLIDRQLIQNGTFVCYSDSSKLSLLMLNHTSEWLEQFEDTFTTINLFGCDVNYVN